MVSYEKESWTLLDEEVIRHANGAPPKKAGPGDVIQDALVSY